jgi:3-deoxy-D-manno-octulosonic-acid transferase
MSEMNLLSVYRGLTVAAGPFVGIYLARRVRRGKEIPARLDERRGKASLARPKQPLIWVHAASVGETASMLAVIDRLLCERPEIVVLMTTGTVTSARLLADRISTNRVIHQFAPLDHPAYVERFLDHWRPDLALWVESELWPNLIKAARTRGIPLLLVNARISARSFRNWRRFPSLVRPLLAGFDLCLAQDPVQAERLRQLGARRALCVGNLKSAAAPLPVSEPELARLARQIAGRPIWLAASTHEGEEEIVADAHLDLKRTHPAILTIIVPRHPARGDGIATRLHSRGLSVACRSLSQPILETTDIYLADSLGELGLFYRLAGIAFIGGSLVPSGGHNPYEAAQLDCAIMFGPDMSNAAAIARTLKRAKAAQTVRDAAEVATTVSHLLGNPRARARRAAAAMEIVEDNRIVLDAVLERLAPWLDRVTPHVAAPA